MILKESEWKLRQQQDQNCAMNEEPLQNKCQDQKKDRTVRMTVKDLSSKGDHQVISFNMITVFTRSISFTRIS